MLATRRTNRRGEEGFALILAILALMLLTSLGLSLSTTTSTELQIATNQRWAKQARYNAEAGVEFAKEILSATPNWNDILPPARPASGSPVTPTWAKNRNDEWGNPTRNYENYTCDQRGYGAGYGVVLDNDTADAPFQFKQGAGGSALNGAFTLWVRRPVVWTNDIAGDAASTTLQDYNGTTEALIVVSEGVAPFDGGTTRSTRRASYIIEVLLSKGGTNNDIILTGESACSARQGQSGGSAQGTNSSGCVALGNGDSLVAALQGSQNLGSGALK